MEVNGCQVTLLDILHGWFLPGYSRSSRKRTSFHSATYIPVVLGIITVQPKWRALQNGTSLASKLNIESKGSSLGNSLSFVRHWHPLWMQNITFQL